MTTYVLPLDMLPCVIPPEHHDDIAVLFAPAIEAVRAGDPDRIIAWGTDELDRLRAFQIVRAFDLSAFTAPGVLS